MAVAGVPRADAGRVGRAPASARREQPRAVGAPRQARGGTAIPPGREDRRGAAARPAPARRSSRARGKPGHWRAVRGTGRLGALLGALVLIAPLAYTLNAGAVTL